MSPEEIVAGLSLEQKAAQMVMPAVYNISPDEMKANGYGSILSTVGSIDAASWRNVVGTYQDAALLSDAGIPYIYGQDDVHGVNYCLDAVYFPHNIGQGAADDEELAYQVGLVTADEAKLCHMLWNYSPCIAQSVDPRWGRTYESYGSNLETITRLSTAYTRGLLDGGWSSAQSIISRTGTWDTARVRRAVPKCSSTGGTPGFPAMRYVSF